MESAEVPVGPFGKLLRGLMTVLALCFLAFVYVMEKILGGPRKVVAILPSLLAAACVCFVLWRLGAL